MNRQWVPAALGRVFILGCLCAISFSPRAIAQTCIDPPPPVLPRPDNGATGTSLTPLLRWDLPCGSGFGNGGFETGDFSSWTPVTDAADQQVLDWVVTQSPGQVNAREANPREGLWFAQNGFDGDAPLRYELYQEVFIPEDANQVVIRWSDRVEWDLVTFCDECTEPRIYQVQIQPEGGGAPLEILFEMQINPMTTGDTGYVDHVADVTAYAGQTIRLNFYEEVNESFTGNAQVNIDAVQLSCNADSMYTVLFGTDVGDLTTLCTTSDQVCDPGMLAPDTTYFWQVIVENDCGMTPGPIWSFTTASDVCRDGDVNLDCAITPLDARDALDAYLLNTTLSPRQQYHADVFNPQDPPVVSPLDSLCIFSSFMGQPSCLDDFPQSCSCQDSR